MRRVEWLLRVPARREGERVTARSNPAQKGLYGHFRATGEPPAVLIIDGGVVEAHRPTPAQLAAASHVFYGGYENEVPDDARDLLLTAGYELVAAE